MSHGGMPRLIRAMAGLRLGLPTDHDRYQRRD